MTAAVPDTTHLFITLLGSRRSAQHLQPGYFPVALFANLEEAASCVPSAFDTQPWHVVILHERNREFWNCVTKIIAERLVGERRDRYLARTENLRHGGLTLLIFEDLARAAPRDGVTPEDARDFAIQALGMLQIVLWLTLSSYGLSASPHHWNWLLEDVACSFAGLTDDRFRLVAIMPVGTAVYPPTPRTPGVSRISRERVDPDMIEHR